MSSNFLLQNCFGSFSLFMHVSIFRWIQVLAGSKGVVQLCRSYCGVVFTFTGDTDSFVPGTQHYPSLHFNLGISLVGFPSVSYGYVLLPLANKETALAYGNPSPHFDLWFLLTIFDSTRTLHFFSCVSCKYCRRDLFRNVGFYFVAGLSADYDSLYTDFVCREPQH